MRNVMRSLEVWSDRVIDLLMGLVRGARSPLWRSARKLSISVNGRLPSLMSRFPTLMGRFPECLDGPFCLLKSPWKTAHYRSKLSGDTFFYRGAPGQKGYSKNISSGKEFPFRSGSKLLRAFFWYLYRKVVAIHANLTLRKGALRGLIGVLNRLSH